MLRELSERKGVEIIEAKSCLCHIHMLAAISLHMSLAQYMGYLKSKSSLMIFDRDANLKYKYGNRHFRYKGIMRRQLGSTKGQSKSIFRISWRKIS